MNFEYTQYTLFKLGQNLHTANKLSRFGEFFAGFDDPQPAKTDQCVSPFGKQGGDSSL